MRFDDTPHDTIIRGNAEKDPNYAPYCGPCPGLVRMKKVVPFYWRCRCGAQHDERTKEELNDSVVGTGQR